MKKILSIPCQEMLETIADAVKLSAKYTRLENGQLELTLNLVQIELSVHRVALNEIQMPIGKKLSNFHWAFDIDCGKIKTEEGVKTYSVFEPTPIKFEGKRLTMVILTVFIISKEDYISIDSFTRAIHEDAIEKGVGMENESIKKMFENMAQKTIEIIGFDNPAPDKLPVIERYMKERFSEDESYA